MTIVNFKKTDSSVTIFYTGLVDFRSRFAIVKLVYTIQLNENRA